MKKIVNLLCAGVLMSALGAAVVACDKKPQPARVSGIELLAALALEVGEKQTLTAIVLPSDAGNKAVSWKSGDESVAEVSPEGEITPIAAGTTTITATADDGGKTASCTVTVTAEPEPEPEPKPGEIKPVPVNEIGDEVAAFFDENLYRIAQSIFEEDGGLPFIDTYVMINGVGELPKADWGGTPFEFQYPDIDFDTYTLVIGYWIGGYSQYLMSQSLVVENGKEATMNLIIGYKKEEGVDYPDVVLPMPFWGFYPKFEAESLHTNVTRKTYEQS